MERSAIAVFVKTPGVSAVKTRLATAIGKAAAEQFYGLSCEAIREVLESFKEECSPSNLEVFWAVAEEHLEAQTYWRGFASLYQGEGELGQRLTQIYNHLISRFQKVAFLGGDCPQLSTKILADAWRLAEDGSFVVGPARDGGFYFFLGQKPLPEGFWGSIPYSSSRTAENLVLALRDCGHSVRFLPYLNDVDQASDLPILGVELNHLPQPTASQEKIQGWLREISY